ncbi:MAG: VWA domain-containing protein [Phycisphaerae bacterium]|nr:VWA domain-containing protein [Phycisphaerae bacterium]
MTFVRPWVLLFLALPIILMFLEWVVKGHPVVMPFDFGSQKRGKFLRILVGIFNMVPSFMLAVAIVFIAGPRQSAPPKDERILTNILFCLDVSGSMTAGFGSKGNRFDHAMEAIEKFTEYRPGDAFGLTFFGGEVLHWVPVTKDVSAIKLSGKFLDPTNPNRPNWLGSTSIGKALEACRNKLIQNKEGDRMIILLTDGFSSDLGNGRDRQIAQKLKEDGIVVYVISVENRIHSQMLTVASITGGEAFPVNEPQALNEVFRHIDKMQASKFKQGSPAMIDNFKPVAIAGFIVLGLQMLAMMGLRYTPW